MSLSPLQLPLPLQTSLKATSRGTAPGWAVKQRQLFDLLNESAKRFIAKYTRPDGTLIWRNDWPGMDGSDDPYEGFMNLALLHALGGDDFLHEASRRIWEGITFQWTEYGQIHREFDAYYDWMHHGEGYLYFYFLGLSGPALLKDRQRAVRFANMYTGDDAEAPNYDKEKKLIRSPLNGSKGPRFIASAEDWSTHRGILDNYLAPYEDIPGVDFASRKCKWSDDTIYAHLLSMMNERMNRGDVPLNLNATGLVANAFMHTADDKYKQWVVDYLAAWSERAARNGGLIPDNVGLNDEIGEYNDGKWWGGYYGYRWPHGFMTVIEPITNATMNAVLLTGDMEQLGLARRQIDLNWSLRKQSEDGRTVVPYKHFDAGWADFREASVRYPIYLWTVSMAAEDLERINRIPKSYNWDEVVIPNVSGKDALTGRDTKHFISNTEPWFRYMNGELPDYPDRILDANFKLITKQLDRMDSPMGDPAQWSSSYNDDDFSSIHIWQELCPVYMESLVQLTLGGPMHISHGGFQHGRFRYFDGDRKRVGLPLDTAALVEQLSDDSATLHLVNTSMFESHTVVIQGGTFGEHDIISATVLDTEDQAGQTVQVNSKWLQVELLPGAAIRLSLMMSRYVNEPTYDGPWSRKSVEPLLTGRTE
ncbi:hypothetical protein [Paenibacillus lignilyticus]|uniref:Linalool dehydratase/isomerase domain-containing protein n=1 Tax=Paenibacillus lignilyticus TaxID=1172615 RepID=A0ABS5CCN7_9BACL|nr:hypothetical protein [Paenibacillus lignilyticus]MBP3961744.1 hypothetical protein [Paenibacillus lignilyticus]MBP3963585.1 hypothetical protein [Paenibacillus lignilyticus]